MNRFSRSFALLLAVMPFFAALPAKAQLLTDYATTADQQTVGAVMDAQGTAAPPASTLQTDYNQLFAGSAANISDSTQSLLPTTAYNLTGVSTTLANVEETNIMGRLRTLRSRDLAAVRQVVRRAEQQPPKVYPLQDTGETLHDLRTGTKAPSMGGSHATQSNYRMVSPLIYKNGLPEADQAPNPTLAEKGYNETMRLSSIGAGAPNATTRYSDTAKVRNIPNLADRTASSALKIAGDAGGQSHINDSATAEYPRRAVVRMNENDQRANALYRGQPLGQLAANGGAAPVPLAPVAPAQPLSVYNGVPPMIFDTGHEPASLSDAAPVPAAAPVQPVFKYKKIDQSKTLTTPMIGSPSSSTMVFPQANAYAIPANPSANNLSFSVNPRASTETGTLLWMDAPAKAKEAAPEASVPQEALAQPAAPETSKPVIYGATAVPLATPAINADRRWGFFISGNTGFGSDDHQNNAAKTQSVTTGITAGVDYRLQNQSFVGMALTYAHSSLTTSNYGDLQGNSAALSVYGTTTYLTDAYLDGYISAGYHSLDSERTVFAGANTTRKATASPDGYQIAAKAETGYDFRKAAWTFGPFAGFRLAYADFDGYTEDGASTFNLKVQGLDNLSAIGTLGFGGSTRYAMSNGGVLVPAMRVGYNHEFGDDQSSIKAEFASLTGSTFITSGAKKARDWMSLAPSVSAALPNDWTLRAQYEHDFFRDDTNENIFNFAANYKW